MLLLSTSCIFHEQSAREDGSYHRGNNIRYQSRYLDLRISKNQNVKNHVKHNKQCWSGYISDMSRKIFTKCWWTWRGWWRREPARPAPASRRSAETPSCHISCSESYQRVISSVAGHISWSFSHISGSCHPLHQQLNASHKIFIVIKNENYLMLVTLQFLRREQRIHQN